MKHQSNDSRNRAYRSIRVVAFIALAAGVPALGIACSSNDTTTPVVSTGTVNPIGATVTSGNGGSTSTSPTTSTGMPTVGTGGAGQGGAGGKSQGTGGAGQGGNGQGGAGGGGLPAGMCTPFNNTNLPLLGANGTLPPLP